MDDLKDKSIHLTAQMISEEIRQMPMYRGFYNEVQKLVSSSCVSNSNFRPSLLNAMRQTGLEVELRNTVFHWLRAHPGPQGRSSSAAVIGSKEPILFLKKAQAQWEKRIQKSLTSMCTELNQVLSKCRAGSDKDEMTEKWTELSTYDIDLSQYRPVYAPKDFLDVLLWIRSPNHRSLDGEGSWDFSQIPLKVKTLSELKSLFQEIARGEPLLGVNPNMPAQNNLYQNLEAERIALGEKVIAGNHAPVAQEFLKRGCPKCLRGKIWAQVLGSQVKEEHVQHFEELKLFVLQYDMIVDKLLIKDVQLTASNDDQYFVFEDVLYQIMLCFSRDTEVLKIFNNSSSTPVTGLLKGKNPSFENSIVFPPSGVIPFHGFSMYATPFCYMYDEPINLYFTFRAFYMRYCFRLHEVSSHEQGILSLCLLFERMLQRHEPTLWTHFKQINIQPVKVVFKWLMRGFSGHLPPDQLLDLWDVVLGYDSLEIFPILAVAILSFRKENILDVDTLQNIEAVLADLSSLSVVALLQLSLMKDSI
ncbi:Hypothetical predicted protein [Cloeon dipterum]|uniref:Rab-GAP TBC domain-containing protein n=2 Tax=Cloeon dipterum TaxID=197152 RepID=A0A8S1DNV5_9INSE|nr:Hypothetical predicted protein [Cloeon dipterum]